MDISQISIILGDITKLDAGAIVNAANSSLLGGGGVDGAIHAAAGSQLLEECKRICKTNFPNGLPTGEAVITSGYGLAARHVIHTVGPIYGHDDLRLLASCYTNSLMLADNNGCTSIAFPSISTGAYGVPIIEAVKIVHKVMIHYVPKNLKKVILVLHSKRDYEIYKEEFWLRLS